MTDGTPPRPTPALAPDEYQGGESVCWLPLLCPTCGALTEDPTADCWRCGAASTRSAPPG